MKKKHSQLQGCPYCPSKWSSAIAFNADQAFTEFRAHLPRCLAVHSDGINKLPEPLSIPQMEVLQRSFKKNTTQEDKWRELYGLLFPGSDIPDPCEFLKIVCCLRCFLMVM